VRVARPIHSLLVLLGLSLGAAGPRGAGAVDWSGSLAADLRVFADDPADPHQDRHDASLVLRPEFRHAWDDAAHRVRFAGHLRVGRAGRDGRVQADVRELEWSWADRHWALRAGIGQVFWGVADAHPLIDVINQTDLVEDIDGRRKLGQPLVGVSLFRDWGTLDAYLLPGFRERRFPARAGRLRPVPRVAPARARFDATGARRHLGWALRWSRHLRGIDLGLAHFSGTAREPDLVPVRAPGGDIVLAPRYRRVDQSSIDLQVVTGAWIWKLEAFTRASDDERFAALVAGVEHTVTGFLGSRADLTLLGEYLYDGRRDRRLVPFADDVFAGARLALNDPASSELRVGVTVDRRSHARLLRIDASRRLGDRWTLALRVRAVGGTQPADPLFSIRRDAHVEVELAHHF
jgi:hypothetical protein